MDRMDGNRLATVGVVGGALGVFLLAIATFVGAIVLGGLAILLGIVVAPFKLLFYWMAGKSKGTRP